VALKQGVDVPTGLLGAPVHHRPESGPAIQSDENGSYRWVRG